LRNFGIFGGGQSGYRLYLTWGGAGPLPAQGGSQGRPLGRAAPAQPLRSVPALPGPRAASNIQALQFGFC
jgi:hypothetical protein